MWFWTAWCVYALNSPVVTGQSNHVGMTVTSFFIEFLKLDVVSSFMSVMMATMRHIYTLVKYSWAKHSSLPEVTPQYHKNMKTLSKKDKRARHIEQHSVRIRSTNEIKNVPYLPCVFLLWWPYSTVARRICISCCETEGRAEKMMDRLLTQLEEEWDQHSCWNFPNPRHNVIMWEWEDAFTEKQREKEAEIIRERKKRGTYCSLPEHIALISHMMAHTCLLPHTYD